MNPRLDALHPYPFEKLRALLASASTQPDGLTPINLSIGEPKHAAPERVGQAIRDHLGGLSVYPSTKGDPALRRAIADWTDEAHVKDNRRLYREKFEAVLPILQNVLDVQRPQASFYLWAATPGSDTAFVRDLYGRTGVTVLPGSFLAREAHGVNPGQGRIRLALVAPLADCVQAAERIAHFVHTSV